MRGGGREHTCWQRLIRIIMTAKNFFRLARISNGPLNVDGMYTCSNKAISKLHWAQLHTNCKELRATHSADVLHVVCGGSSLDGHPLRHVT